MSNWVNVVLNARGTMQSDNAYASERGCSQLAECLIEACSALKDVHVSKICANFAVTAFHAAFLLKVRFIFYWSFKIVILMFFLQGNIDLPSEREALLLALNRLVHNV